MAECVTSYTMYITFVTKNKKYFLAKKIKIENIFPLKAKMFHIRKSVSMTHSINRVKL